jgi:PIN domain nuclease of toxin-antitoxin system
MNSDERSDGLMITRFVLDTSALLAMMQDAPGGSLVGVKLHNSAISTLNLTEVLDYCNEHDLPTTSMVKDLRALGLEIHPFTEEDAHHVADLGTRLERQLSVADRACVALAHRLSLPALSADRSWKQLDLGIEVRVLR